MSNSKYLASLIGPILLAVTTAEFVNVRIFSANTAPVIFFNGMVLLTAGFAIVRAHNKWMWAWPVIVTLVGWGLTFLGLFRMFAPEVQMATSENAKLIGILFPLATAAFLTYFGYRRER